MAYKMKGSKFYGKGNSSPLKQSQAKEAKKVTAKSTISDEEAQGINIENISAVQVDKNKNKFVTELSHEESYSGDDENVIESLDRKNWKGNYNDINNRRDTVMVSNKYPKGHLIDETQWEEGDATKQGTPVPPWSEDYVAPDYKKNKTKP